MPLERSDDGAVTAHLTVRRHGDLVTDLEPYLGANGHLVALRTGDLAYAHVHPVEDDDAEPGVVTFDAELTSAGRYGLFFDFKHNATVHTAAFTFDQGPVTGDARHGDARPMTDHHFFSAPPRPSPSTSAA